MIRFGAILAAAIALAACPDMQGEQGLLPIPVADTPEARDCIVMGYRIGTSRHDYCVQVMSRRVTPDEYN